MSARGEGTAPATALAFVALAGRVRLVKCSPVPVSTNFETCLRIPVTDAHL